MYMSQKGKVVQTFLPYSDFYGSGFVLDTRRLGKQVIETGQIVRALLDESYGWQHHPATKMWRGHVSTLLKYADEIHLAWQSRQGKPHMAYYNMYKWLLDKEWASTNPPGWLNGPIHASHRSALLRKDLHYHQFNWEITHDEYIWPTHELCTKNNAGECL